ncbi:hypothetical protein Q7C36_011665 [Tachysurus vachellii]|uniref:ADF-H domain-containing protein n=2 Tax=Tachysurus vachellii TaxID=175792 RepID=A0AA88SLI9_TACVA|nr:hypothetical protein Q7C36_011665 [Tachysurus vachellii]
MVTRWVVPQNFPVRWSRGRSHCHCRVCPSLRLCSGEHARASLPPPSPPSLPPSPPSLPPSLVVSRSHACALTFPHRSYQENSHIYRQTREPSENMASGVTVNDDVIKVFNDMKVRKSSTSDEVKKRKKAVLFCLSQDKKKIIVEEDKQILVGDIGETVDDPYACFVKLLPLNDCRYGLYDATYETKESKKEDLVFIFWAPEGAPLKSKMIYASSKDAIKKKFTGIKHEWQVNGLDDIQDRSTLAEKLGGNVVVSLEGRPL